MQNICSFLNGDFSCVPKPTKIRIIHYINERVYKEGLVSNRPTFMYKFIILRCMTSLC